MRQVNKTTIIFLVFFMIIGVFSLSYQPPILAEANTTNNDIIMDCSQCKVEVGKEKSITATITPASDTSLKWKVDPPNIVYLVNKRGGTIKVKGLKEGTATITAYHGNGSNIGNGNKSVSCTITVSSVPKPPAVAAELKAEVKASQPEIVKPSNGNAQGSMDITLTPIGTALNSARQPVDIVFVVDKSSSSMNGNKLSDAKKAVQEAVNILKPVNSGSTNMGDQMALVSFSDDAEVASGLTNNFDQILTKFPTSTANNTNSNYAAALTKAQEILGYSSHKKYVVFLTGGKPTKSVNYEWVTKNKDTISGPNEGYQSGNKYVHYLLSNGVSSKYFYDGNDKYIFNGVGYNVVLDNVKNHVTTAATNLANQNIKLFTIGIGPDQDLDKTFLSNISVITGGKTYQGTTSENLNTVLRSVSEEVNAKLTMTNVKFKIKIQGGLLGQNVQIKPNDPTVSMEGDYAVFKLKDVPYSSNGNAPTIANYNLPLEFKQVGTYIFDDAKLEYQDPFVPTPKLYVLPKDKPVTIKVLAQREPTFTGTMVYVPQQVDKLVISESTELKNDTFMIKYTLNPTADSLTTDANMTEIKLIQPLPKGITVLNSGSGIRINGDKAEIDFNSVDFKSGRFSLPTQERQLVLRVDWAMNMQLGNPQVLFKNNGLERSVSITAPSQHLESKVKLSDNQRGFIYEGDELGRISKISQSDNSVIDSSVFTPYPVKKLTFKDDYYGLNRNVIRIESRDVVESADYTDYLTMMPSIELRRALSQYVIDEDEERSNEDVVAALDELISDPNLLVRYEYRIIKNSSIPNEWTRLTRWSDIIPLTGDGSYVLEVKGIGGFASGDAASRSIIIDKSKPNNIPNVKPIPDQSLIVGGESKFVDISQAFEDPDGDQLTISVEVVSNSSASADIAKVSLQNNQPLLTSGHVPGEITVKVTASDGRGGTASTTFKVTVYTVNQSPKVESIPNQTTTVGTPITLNLSSYFSDPDGDTLTYTASSANSNSAGTTVSGNTLTIDPKATGTVTITVIANDGKGGTVSTTFNVTINRTNQAPIAQTIPNQTTTVGTPITLDLSEYFNDSDGDTLTYTASSANTNSAGTTVSGNTLTIDPKATGTVTITVIANDGKGGTVSTTFNVTINRANQAPIAQTIPNQTTTVGTPITLDLSKYFSDSDGDTLTYTASSANSNSAGTTVSGNTLTIDPKATGTVTITVIANDGKGGTVSTTFNVTINRANQSPIAQTIPNQTTTVGTPITLDLSEYFSDSDGDTLTYTASSANTNSAGTTVSGNTLTIDPKATGTVTITVTANDGKGGTVSKSFTVNIIPPVPNFEFDKEEGSVKIIGKVAFAKISADNSTIMDNTDWYKYEFDGSKWDWVKFHTGILKTEYHSTEKPTHDAAATVAIRLENVTDGKIKLQIKAVTPNVDPVPKLLEIARNPSAPNDNDNDKEIKINVSSSQAIGTSGNRAARVGMSYTVTLPEGTDYVFADYNAAPERGTDGKITRYLPGKPGYEITVDGASKPSLTGVFDTSSLRNDGVNDNSIPIVKFIKSSTGKSFKLNVKVKVRLLVQTDTDEGYIDLPLEGSKELYVLSREKLR